MLRRRGDELKPERLQPQKHLGVEKRTGMDTQTPTKTGTSSGIISTSCFLTGRADTLVSQPSMMRVRGTSLCTFRMRPRQNSNSSKLMD